MIFVVDILCLKSRHVWKPAMSVTPEGCILTIQGPYFSNAANFDANILSKQFKIRHSFSAETFMVIKVSRYVSIIAVEVYYVVTFIYNRLNAQLKLLFMIFGVFSSDKEK